ncbi:hypothetical protein RBH20_18155 [Haloarcula sp. H-GB4]|uniref:hypothetical protein n=1 Tax=Haloarcula sp. H-GB4 TaxID=3069755 RepID=UPI0027B5B243|nr:hypothetical protein [Haloarcula sp. H-GB4]MDQ2074459.1 hypothetical protein [Haloarcula sp. H-GB4]
MSRIGRTQLLKMGGFSVLVMLVLAGLPFLRRNGYISGSMMLATFSTLSILAGGWMIRSPEKHDRVVANKEDYSASKVRWRRVEERLGGVVAAGVGLVFIYIERT